jgi:hypothetical protein
LPTSWRSSARSISYCAISTGKDVTQTADPNDGAEG